MNEGINLNSYFDKDYFIGGNKSNYYYYGVADDMVSRCLEIIEKYHPKRLLDIGCAYGYFVGTFRKNGVDAYGIDISEFAIEQACEEAKRYIFKAKAQDIPFPDNFFDLIVSWDTLEHIPEQDLPKATSEINRVGQRQRIVIATEILLGDKDKSHVIIKPLEWWKKYLPNADLFGSTGCL